MKTVVDNGFMEWLRKRCEVLPDGVTVEDVADQTFIFDFCAFDLREAWIAAKAEGMEAAACVCESNPFSDGNDCGQFIRAEAVKLLEG